MRIIGFMMGIVDRLIKNPHHKVLLRRTIFSYKCKHTLYENRTVMDIAYVAHANDA